MTQTYLRNTLIALSAAVTATNLIANAQTVFRTPTYEKQLSEAMQQIAEGGEYSDTYETFSVHGDCLGFGPTYGQKTGNFVQSDVQFAQQVAADIRKNGGLDESIYMDLDMRFYMSEIPEDNKMVSAGLIANYGEGFQGVNEQALRDWYGLQDLTLSYEDFEKEKRLGPSVHGHYEWRKMSGYDKITLKNKQVTTFFFDQDDHFAGLAIMDLDTGTKAYHVPINVEQLTAELVSEDFLAHHEHVRLIGWRTGKLCADSKMIEQITPIYYSTSEDVCKTMLTPLSLGLSQEIPYYGLRCYDSRILNQVEADADTDRFQVLERFEGRLSSSEKDGANSTFKLLTYIIIWVTFVSLLVLTVVQLSAGCQDKAGAGNQKSVVELGNDRREQYAVRENEDFASMPQTERDVPPSARGTEPKPIEL